MLSHTTDGPLHVRGKEVADDPVTGFERHLMARTTLQEVEEANIARRRENWLAAKARTRRIRLQLIAAEKTEALELAEYTHATVGAN